MRKILLFIALILAKPSFATSYFVKAAGSNANTGLSDAQAWAFSPGMVGCNSVCASTTIVPGDTIQFNRGDTWRDTLTPTVAGTPSAQINYTAYGAGQLPIISGANILTGWVAAAPAYFSASLAVKPGNVITDAFARLTQNVTSIASLTPGQWFWDSGTSRVYVRLIGDNNPCGHTVEGTERSFGIQNAKAWLTFNNISVYGTTSIGHYENSFADVHTVITNESSTWNDFNGMLFRAGFVTCTNCIGSNNLLYGLTADGPPENAHDLTLNNPVTKNNAQNGLQFTGTLNVTVNGGEGSFNGTPTLEGDAISITSIGGVNAANIAINNYSAHDNLGNGLSAFGDSFPSGASNITVTGGLWYHNLTGIDPSSGIRFDQNTNNSTVQYAVAFNNQSGGIVNEVGANNNKILYNIVYGNHDGLAQSNATGVGVVWYGNISYGNTEWGFAHVSGSASATVKNNILMNNGVAGYFTDGSGTPDVVDFNDVFNNAGNSANYIGICKPTHDINADPLFAFPAGGIFYLLPGSPAINAGANLGPSFQMGLDPRTPLPPFATLNQNLYGPGWEIGAFVFIQ